MSKDEMDWSDEAGGTDASSPSNSQKRQKRQVSFSDGISPKSEVVATLLPTKSEEVEVYPKLQPNEALANFLKSVRAVNLERYCELSRNNRQLGIITFYKRQHRNVSPDAAQEIIDHAEEALKASTGMEDISPKSFLAVEKEYNRQIDADINARNEDFESRTGITSADYYGVGINRSLEDCEYSYLLRLKDGPISQVNNPTHYPDALALFEKTSRVHGEPLISVTDGTIQITDAGRDHLNRFIASRDGEIFVREYKEALNNTAIYSNSKSVIARANPDYYKSVPEGRTLPFEETERQNRGSLATSLEVQSAYKDQAAEFNALSGDIARKIGPELQKLAAQAAVQPQPGQPQDDKLTKGPVRNITAI